MLVIADELVDKFAARTSQTVNKINSTLGQELENFLFNHPFYVEKHVPIILGDHVTTEDGTGLVHTAPAHGLDDYVVGMKYNLPVENPVNEEGSFKSNVEFFAGQNIWKANSEIIDLLIENGALIFKKSFEHSYPHCWRHKTPIIFRATQQWFIGMNLSLGQKTLRDIAKEQVEQTEFIPSWGKARLEGMMKNRPDWCISRQRNWGVPITIFTHLETDEPHPKTGEYFEKIALLIEEHGIDAWFDLDINEWLGDDAKHYKNCLLYTSPSPRDRQKSRMPSSA